MITSKKPNKPTRFVEVQAQDISRLLKNCMEALESTINKKLYKDSGEMEYLEMAIKGMEESRANLKAIFE